MKNEYRVLILEDSADDAELIQRLLKQSKLTLSLKLVKNKQSFLDEIELHFPDVILSDYELPQFDGLSALAYAKKRKPEVPFIMISGKIADEFAAETLRKGATDYILKDRLQRLVPAVERAIREVEHKRIATELEEHTIILERENMEMRGREEKVIKLKRELEELRNELKRME